MENSSTLSLAALGLAATYSKRKRAFSKTLFETPALSFSVDEKKEKNGKKELFEKEDITIIVLFFFQSFSQTKLLPFQISPAYFGRKTFHAFSE